MYTVTISHPNVVEYEMSGPHQDVTTRTREGFPEALSIAIHDAEVPRAMAMLAKTILRLDGLTGGDLLMTEEEAQLVLAAERLTEYYQKLDAAMNDDFH